MFAFLLRAVQRFAVLIPGIIIAYVSVHTILPRLDQRLPLGLAIFVTYILGAYLLIPALSRLGRIIWRPKHLPTYCVTPDGFASDPLNIAIRGSRTELITAMEAAGWVVADKLTVLSSIRFVIRTLTNQPYPTAPMSSLYLLGRKQDIGFELVTDGTRGQRHHVRFWIGAVGDGAPYSQHIGRSRPRPAHDQMVTWLGAASRDIGYTLIRHNVQISHLVDPDTDAERDRIVADLSRANQLASVDTIKLGAPYRLANYFWRRYLESDGIMAVCTLANHQPSAAASVSS